VCCCRAVQHAPARLVVRRVAQHVAHPLRLDTSVAVVAEGGGSSPRAGIDSRCSMVSCCRRGSGSGGRSRAKNGAMRWSGPDSFLPRWSMPTSADTMLL